jgi:hypothetical protein
MDTVAKNLMEVRPTVVTGVPRFYEKLRERIEAAVISAPPAKRNIFHWAIRVGQLRAERVLEGKPVPLGLALQFWLADHLAFSKLRLRLGGDVRAEPNSDCRPSEECREVPAIDLSPRETLEERCRPVRLDHDGEVLTSRSGSSITNRASISPGPSVRQRFSASYS